MLPYERVRAIQDQRVARFVDERQRAEARRKASRKEPGGLSELLNALAQGLAGIGMLGGDGKNHPAAPAF
jgi:hypothetical protein